MHRQTHSAWQTRARRCGAHRVHACEPGKTFYLPAWLEKALTNANLNPLACDLLREDDFAERGRSSSRVDRGPAIEQNLWVSLDAGSGIYSSNRSPGDITPTVQSRRYSLRRHARRRCKMVSGVSRRGSSRHELLVGRFSFEDDGTLVEYETREIEYAHPNISNVRRVLARRNRANQ